MSSTGRSGSERRPVRRRYDFVYEDGAAHNAEAFIADPTTGRLSVVSKQREGAAIYQAPEKLSTSGVNVLRRVQDAPVLITGGATFNDGPSFVLRSHNWAYVYADLASAPRMARLPDLRQGECIEVAADGDLLVGSEGVNSPIERVSGDFLPVLGTYESGWAPTAPAVPRNGSVTPEAFGAFADGTHDDSGALQKALDPAAATGARVSLAANLTYLSSRALEVPSNTYLYGAGSSSVLRFNWRLNDSSHDGFYLGNEDQTTDGNTDITFTGCKVMGGGDGLPAGPNLEGDIPHVPGIRLRLVDRFQITNLEVSNAPGISIIFQGSSDGLVRGNYIHNSGRDGINSTWHKQNMHDVVIERNRITKIGDDGIAVIGSPGQTPNLEALPYNITVRNNNILGWPDNPNGRQIGRGILVMAATKVTVRNNKIDRTHSTGILVVASTREFSYDPATGAPWPSSYVEVLDNTVIDAGQAFTNSAPEIPEAGHDGITVKRSNNITLLDNAITNPYGEAISLFSCTACSS